MPLLISDANILIDSEDGNLTSIIFQLHYEFAVPDILFELELRELHGHLLNAGLKVKSLSAESIKMTERLVQKYPKASMMDHAALALARQEHCPLLTGDKHLRTAAEKENLEVHGTVWIMEQLRDAKLITQEEAKKSLDSMRAKGSRLPMEAIENLLNNKWAPAGAKNE